MDGAILLGPAYENLCRRASPREFDQLGGKGWVIESQGLPNLLHELLHALFLGRLENDHGFDYGEIPLDLTRRDHRQFLWEELSCCASSAMTCARWAKEPDVFRCAWFTEQFEIQGVFHGLEHDLGGFRQRVEVLLGDPERRAEWRETFDRGQSLLEGALAGVGVRLPEQGVRDPLSVWDEYRASW